MAHIALVAYELETGGISRVAVHLANGFADAGHRVSLVLCSAEGELHGPLAGALGQNVDLVILSRARARSRALGQAACWRALRRWLRAERPDVLLGTANNISWFAGLALLGLPGKAPALFIKTTNPILRKGDGPLLTAMRRWGYARLFGAAGAVLTLSEAENAVLDRQFEGQFAGPAARFRSVFNPYLTPEFLAEAEAVAGSGPKDGPLLLCLGRISPQKNFARAIRAFGLARGKAGALAKARLLIAGEGPLRGELEALTAELGLVEAVEFCGFAHDAPALMRRASLLVLSSEYEGLPAVVIEALGSGCPVAATDCFPAARELLEGVTGCRVCGLTDEALAEAIISALDEAPDRAVLSAKANDYSLPSAIASHLGAMGL